MSETELSKAIREALTAKGCWVIRQQSGYVPMTHNGKKRVIRMGEPGTPDLLVMFSPDMPQMGIFGAMPAEFGFMEVKTQKGKLTEAQETWHERAADCGIRCRVVRSVSEALKVLSEWREEQ